MPPYPTKSWSSRITGKSPKKKEPEKISYQYARRRKHRPSKNPFNHRWILKDGVYVADGKINELITLRYTPSRKFRITRVLENGYIDVEELSKRDESVLRIYMNQPISIFKWLDGSPIKLEQL